MAERSTLLALPFAVHVCDAARAHAGLPASSPCQRAHAQPLPVRRAPRARSLCAHQHLSPPLPFSARAARALTVCQHKHGSVEALNKSIAKNRRAVNKNAPREA